jgi:hypothetical protein
VEREWKYGMRSAEGVLYAERLVLVLRAVCFVPA